MENKISEKTKIAIKTGLEELAKNSPRGDFMSNNLNEENINELAVTYEKHFGIPTDENPVNEKGIKSICSAYQTGYNSAYDIWFKASAARTFL